MPPKTRAKRSKENVKTIENKQKIANKTTKSTRKPLADKTNSASDDNTSLDIKRNSVAKCKPTPVIVADIENERPRRARRLPERFIENSVLKNLSTSKCLSTTLTSSSSPIKDSISNNSIIQSRSKRITRLASKFEDHSVSPSRNVSVQPCHSSTPIAQNKPYGTSESVTKQTVETATKSTKKKISKLQQNLIEYYLEKDSSDTNNNPKRAKKKFGAIESPSKNSTSSGIKSKNVHTLNSSFRLLENKKTREESNNQQDVYEFTFDPDLEPPPQKKKKKRAVKKKAEKPKTVIFKSNYDQKVAKSLEMLKNKVSNNVTQKQTIKIADDQKKIQGENRICFNDDKILGMGELSNKNINNINQNINNDITNQVNNHVSVRIEDIPEQLDQTPEHHEMNYSPVYSPIASPIHENMSNRDDIIPRPHSNDPLNLQDNISFFDDQPNANSSLNTSKHPTASPWRVEFNNLPIKWKPNTYVKPNLTPAFECSYIETSNKKQVYTNILSEPHNLVPETESTNTNLKQTSMISFIRDTVNKSLNKSKNKNCITPTKQNSLFEESLNTSLGEKVLSPINIGGPTSDQSNIMSSMSNTEHNSDEISTKLRKRKNEDPIQTNKIKNPRKENDITLFGFDDSENVDQENVSPEIIDKRRRRNLRPKSRTVLRELNELAGPTRAVAPGKGKLGMNSEVVNKIYEELKDAAPAPLFPEKEIDNNQHTKNFNADSDSDSNSVHLFEDIELIHHLKAARKSYSKPKKVVTFRQGSSSDSDDEPPQEEQDDSPDDLSDLTFHVPVAEKKKTGRKKMTKKHKIAKKEEKEAEQWAAQFNSMCEDVEEFDLVVE